MASMVSSVRTLLVVLLLVVGMVVPVMAMESYSVELQPTTGLYVYRPGAYSFGVLRDLCVYVYSWIVCVCWDCDDSTEYYCSDCAAIPWEMIKIATVLSLEQDIPMLYIPSHTTTTIMKCYYCGFENADHRKPNPIRCPRCGNPYGSKPQRESTRRRWR